MNNLLYNALMLGRNKEVENEEFLVAEEKKEPAAFKVIEEKIDIPEVIEDTPFTVHLELVKEGYLEIEVFCVDDIIQLERKIITTEDFADNKFEFKLVFLGNKIHNGMNFTELIFRTSNQEFKIPVTVDNRIKLVNGIDVEKQISVTLTKNYLDFRLNRIPQKEWIRRGLELLDNITGNDRKALFWMLYKAQLYIADGRDYEALNILEYVEEQLPKLLKPDYELSSYYLYIKSLYQRDEEQIEDALEKIRLVYMRVPSWRILWILFYMDYRYQDNLERKIEEIEILFNNGCVSPEIYFEALEVYLKRPDLLSELNDFNVQVLNFAVKNEYLNSGLVDRLPEVILSMDLDKHKNTSFNLTINILKIFYKKDPSGNILKALCTLLILTKNKNTENHDYFKRAVREAFTIKELYHYYIYTMDKKKMEPIPDKIIEYFSKNIEEIHEYRSYFYANLIENKLKNPSHYRNNVNMIVSYANEQLSVGRVDDWLGIIVKDILDNDLVTGEIEKNLFVILYSKKIICNNKRMVSVLVFHNELNLYQDVFLEDGKAFVYIYSKSAIVLFKDVSGNIYANVDYDKEDLIDTGEYVDIFIKNAPINRYMLLEDTLPLLNSYREPVEILKYLSKQLKTGLLRTEYEKKIMNIAVKFFSKKDDPEIYDALLSFKKFNLDEETSAKIIEIMINQTYYMQAYDEIEKTGFKLIKPEAVSKLAHVLTGFSSYDKEDKLLLDLCEFAFLKTPFDKEIFDYLSSFYNDSVEVLVELFRAAKAYGENTEAVAEKVLKRAVETRNNPEGTFYVFENYYNSGSNELLKDEYLTLRAEKYLFENETKEKDFFKFLESGFVMRHNYEDVVYAAYIYYILDLPAPKESQISQAATLLKNLTKKGIMLEKFKEFKKFKNKAEIPSTLSNSIVVSKFVTEGNKTPQITYVKIREDGEENKETTEEMTRLFKGAYAKYFTLFEGETLNYKIDDEEEKSVDYSDFEMVKDGSRFAELNEMIVLYKDERTDELKEKAKEYYVKERLVNRFFKI